jgi:hypothetical protein
MKRLNNEVKDEEELQKIVSTLELIFTNVIQNPGNEKYYKVNRVIKFNYLLLNRKAMHLKL